MTQQRAGGKAAGWRAMVLIGALGNAVGLIGRVPVITLVAAPLFIIGMIGLMTSLRRQRS